MQITFLGTGTSGGVPLVGCACEVCSSTDEKDKRLRSSVLIQTKGKNILIDAGPDFRQQMLREKVTQLDALLVTHGHRDHIGGLDDIRPFNYIQKQEILIWCDALCERMIREQYSYAFKDTDYPYLPKMKFVQIDRTPFRVHHLEVIPVEVMHAHMPVKGFRFGSFAYITDAKTIADEELAKLKGTKVLVVNALRYSNHISHFTVDEALAFAEKVKPDITYFTHISHQLGKHELIKKQLPTNVCLAYDGLKIEVAI